MHPDTSAVTVDQTADHQLLLMQSGLGTQKLQDQRRQILLIDILSITITKASGKRCQNPFTIMEQTPFRKIV